MATLLCTVVATLAVSLILPKTYRAISTIVLNYKGVDPVSGQPVPAQLMPTYIMTQVDVVSSMNVALRVVDKLKLADSPVVREEFIRDNNGLGDIRVWLAALLLKKLEVVPMRESSVVDIAFKNTDPEFAALIANTFASEYQQTNVLLKVEPLKKASAYFNEQIKALRDNLETAQNRLSKYQQEKGLVSIDNRLDVESSRLNELSTQLVIVQGQLAEATSRQHQVQVRRGSESPDIVANPLIQSLKTSLAQAQAKFADISQRLDKKHPQYQSAKAELEQMRAEINDQIRLTSNSVTNNARILEQREAEVRRSLEEQKEKVLKLNRARDELSLLSKEVESAQRAYEGSVIRFNQTNLEGQANQTDIAILNQATPPTEAASPKIGLNLMLAVFFGTVLGVTLGLFAEYVDRRVRSESDLFEITAAPSFGTVVTSEKRTRSMLPRKTSSYSTV